MLKPALAFLSGAVLTVALALPAAELKPDHPETYVVQKGDTLWDIAGRFLSKPWLWPEIWQANPQIENPHLIYPGDVLTLVYDAEGRARLVRGTRKLSPQVRSEPLASAIKPVPLGDIEGFLKRFRMLDENWRQLPYVVALEENRLRSASGQLIHVRRLYPDAKIGQDYAIVRPTAVYRDVPTNYPWSIPKRRMTREGWDGRESFTLADGLHWVFKNREWWDNVATLGYEAVEVGTARVSALGETASLLVLSSWDGIKPGDLVVPIERQPFDFTYYPHAPERVPANMRVLAFTDAVRFVGHRQVVAINKGARDGVANGQVYFAHTDGEVVDDRVRFASNDLRTTLTPRRDDVKLPDTYTGTVMIFRTFDHVSYGLVMDGVRPVKLLDRLAAPN
ncbi:MAG: LysM peptidoglycan-binding domain-containing protein [Xanthomonadales bacterium]|nr:LysM peptidoglycan-binding domain-containing protein [Xanthomonadales bacterium]